jgi:hypothetical protein
MYRSGIYILEQADSSVLDPYGYDLMNHNVNHGMGRTNHRNRLSAQRLSDPTERSPNVSKRQP